MAALGNILNIGHLIHLRRTIEYLNAGNEIIFEGISQKGDILRKIGTFQEAIQMKAVVEGTGPPFHHIGAAAQQFATTEPPPLGYLKSVELHIALTMHPLMTSSTSEFLRRLNKWFVDTKNLPVKGQALKDLEEVRIYNSQGVHVFKYDPVSDNFIIK